MSDMKCPFCQQELDKVYLIPEALVCMNCHRLATKELWQELIRTRKALEGIKKVVDGFGWGCGNMHLPDYHDGLIIAEIVNEALEQKDVK